MESCDEFFGKIKSHFDFLFKDFGFSWASNNEEELGFDNCYVILKSDNCCIDIIKDRGNVLIEIGPSNSTDENAFYIDYIIDFINKDTTGKKRNQRQKEFFEGTDKSGLYDYIDHELPTYYKWNIGMRPR